jgi:cobalt-zinc-cadmium efflux system outer membrane protein
MEIVGTWWTWTGFRGPVPVSIDTAKCRACVMAYRRFVSLAVGGALLLAAGASPVRAAELAARPIFTLPEVLKIALERNPGVAVAAAQREAAEAGRLTARAYPNPTIELGGGSSRGRQPGVVNGNAWALGFAQPLEYPGLRNARSQTADAGVATANASFDAFRVSLTAAVRGAFYEVLRRQAEVALAGEDTELLRSVRNRVEVRVQTGEAPRFDLIRADAELLNAIKTQDSAVLRVQQAKAILARLAGALPLDYDVKGELEPDRSLPPLAAMREQLLATSPEFARAQAELKQAEARLKVERELRLPPVTLVAGSDQDPDRRNILLGLSVPLPLWNRREGPIAEAVAAVAGARARVDDLRLALTQELEIAFQRYLINQRQVTTFESGLLKQAEAALKVAEAAYRFGERGILDYLDAQRTYRSVRADYLNARYELQYARIDIDRLRAVEP